MRDKFSKHRYPGQEHRRLLEAAERTVSRSFRCLGFVVSQSIIVSRTACLFCGAECVVCVVVVFLIKITCLHCSQYFVMFMTSHHWRNVFGSLPALQMTQGPERRSLAMKGARLLGWLARDGFQTLLVLMMLSAGQQKGNLSSWRELPLRRGRSSRMVRVRE